MAAHLPVLWALIIGLAVFLYVVLDGFDLGVGILFGVTREESHRRQMMAAVAPVWDGNETWLVVVGASLYACFPMVYAILLPAFYLPFTLLLVSLILRGVAFEFRYKTERNRWIWDAGFFGGSLVAAFVQGAAVGAMVDELPVAAGRFVGGPFEWLTPFAVTCGVGLVVGYTLLGAAWLVLKTEGGLHDWAWQLLLPLLAGVLLFLVVVTVYSLAIDLPILRRWFDRPWLFIFPALGAVATFVLVWGVRTRRHDRLPFYASMLIFLSALATMAASFWPYMVPFSVTIAEAASPPQTLSFMFYGAALVVMPVMLIYTALAYWVFRGKVREDTEYH
jgi:cytochrome d ubiquinol oxidase subunit II